MRFSLLLASMLGCTLVFGQNVSKEIDQLNTQIESFTDSIRTLNQRADSLKLQRISQGLEAMGWPGSKGELVQHHAMALDYIEKYEMADWVAHVITTDIAGGGESRTNNFRVDPLVTTGTTDSSDFFKVTVGQNGKKTYDGYGFDRGHLAPSADFRWSKTALSESYFYSNMSPQVADFNRGSWAELESTIRQYAVSNNVNLFVVTGPVLNDNLPTISKSPNGLVIPEYYYKVVLDTLNNREIGFIMPNTLITNPLLTYAVSVDSVEAITGLDFFKNFRNGNNEEFESTASPEKWLSGTRNGDVEILKPSELGKNQYNTIQAYDYMNSNKKVEICGTVVRTFKSKKNNVFIDLDKQFPNTVFSISIWSRDAANFSYSPEVELMSKKVCVYGQVKRSDKALQMNITNEKQLKFLDEDN